MQPTFIASEYTVCTLGDIFKTLEMRRFFKEFAIFSDGQNFGFQNKIRRIIFDVFLSISRLTSLGYHLEVIITTR
jgi:hypothetical protein